MKVKYFWESFCGLVRVLRLERMAAARGTTAEEAMGFLMERRVKGLGWRLKGWFFGFLPCEMGSGGGFLCLFLRIFALKGVFFLLGSARFFIFLRRSFHKGVFFLD